jgi:hypothetical protein
LFQVIHLYDADVVMDGEDMGDMVMAKAWEVLREEFSEIAAKIRIHVPDEESWRVGRALVAASLPSTRR